MEHLHPKNFCEDHFRDIFTDLQIIPTIFFFARSAALCALKFGVYKLSPNGIHHWLDTPFLGARNTLAVFLFCM
jgi:hypothetical protein